MIRTAQKYITLSKITLIIGCLLFLSAFAYSIAQTIGDKHIYIDAHGEKIKTPAVENPPSLSEGYKRERELYVNPPIPGDDYYE